MVDTSAFGDAGANVGDVIVAVNGERVQTMNQLATLMRFYRAGDVITVTVVRDGEQVDLEVELADRFGPVPDPVANLIGLQELRLAAAPLGNVVIQVGRDGARITGAKVSLDEARALRERLEAALPDVSISLSSDVSPQMREYERFNTTCANAYVKPMMEAYLGRLRDRLAAAGAPCPIFLMHSGGGIMSLENAAQFPVRLVESGPAGGAIYAADVARRHGLSRVLSFDMGGTTAKICLIRDGAPKTARVFEVARSYRFKKGSGMPISIPVIDMVEIGAGGGSLAHIDSLGQIRVGPESAGSEPGPACYMRGGERPAVTDAEIGRAHV